MGVQLTYALFTDAGSRPVNEDAVGVCENGENRCFLLCDGLGGHGMGDVASNLCKTVFMEQFKLHSHPTEFLNCAFMEAERTLMAEQKIRSAKHKMKTTAVALVTDARNAYIGHVGDSRLYAFHHNKVKMRTLDHSIPQMLVVSREIKESQIRNHPDRNMLLRVLGVEWDEPMYELMAPCSLKKGQAFLLCSDGFWELIEEKEMCLLLKKSATVEQWLTQMAQVVKANGVGRNMDNYSAIAVWCK